MSRSGSRTVRFAGRMRTTNNQLPSLDKNQRQTDLVLAGLRRLSTVTIILGYRYPSRFGCLLRCRLHVGAYGFFGRCFGRSHHIANVYAGASVARQR
jgi:hypothetical protein